MVSIGLLVCCGWNDGTALGEVTLFMNKELSQGRLTRGAKLLEIFRLYAW